MQRTYTVASMIIGLHSINEFIEDDAVNELGYFTSQQEIVDAAYCLLSWMGKSGLPICNRIANYPPRYDKRLRCIEDLIWDNYWVKISDDIFIDHITISTRPNIIQINYNLLWEF